MNFALIAGAEPSSVLDRVRACHDHIPLGVVFTNGPQRIPAEIGYRIHVSIGGGMPAPNCIAAPA